MSENSSNRGAHASRVLVSASRRNSLFSSPRVNGRVADGRKVRDREDAIANTRDACAPQTML